MAQKICVLLCCVVLLLILSAINIERDAEDVVVKDIFQLRHHSVSYNERGGSVHADDSAINPAKKPLHYQLNVPSGWTLHRQTASGTISS